MNLFSYRDYTEEDLVYVYSLFFSDNINDYLKLNNLNTMYEENIFTYIKNNLCSVSSRLLIEVFDATVKLLNTQYNINILLD